MVFKVVGGVQMQRALDETHYLNSFLDSGQGTEMALVILVNNFWRAQDKVVQRTPGPLRGFQYHQEWQSSRLQGLGVGALCYSDSPSFMFQSVLGWGEKVKP